MNRPPYPIRTARWQPLRAMAAAVLLFAAGSPAAMAQPAEAEELPADAGAARPAPVPAASGPSSVPHGARTVSAGPPWSALSTEQRAALAPLAPHWNGFSESRKRKWLAMTRDFRDLSPEERARAHDRMANWVALSPRQRAETRFNFATAQERLSAGTRKERWESYQALSSDEKHRLAAAAPAAPAKGAATPVHVPASVPPAIRLAAPPAGAAPAAEPADDRAMQRARIQHNTLLPARAVPGMPVEAPRARIAP